MMNIQALRLQRGWCSPANRFPDTSPLVTRTLPLDLHEHLPEWISALGFSHCGISRADTSTAMPRLRAWLDAGMHGDMGFMATHAHLRANPQDLVPGTLSVISVSLPYWPEASQAEARATLQAPGSGYVSRYALGRDYHKVFRQRLQKLADHIAEQIGPFGYRVFTDSAPVLEVEFATQARLGWRGKHSLLLNRTGSWFFLGEIYTDLPITPTPSPPENHCGSCTRCLSACPTAAIVEPYRVDARRCISYLTIEHTGAIPLDLRPLMGNRIYGCDDCQLACPWNRFASQGDPAFAPKNGLDQAQLIELFGWTEDDFNTRLQGSPIRRIGHERWLRNIAVALGNALRQSTDSATQQSLKAALSTRASHPSTLVVEHVQWALNTQ